MIGTVYNGSYQLNKWRYKMIVQKTISLNVMVTVEYDDEIASNCSVPDIRDNVSAYIQQAQDDGELFYGETSAVKEYSVEITSIQPTAYEY